MPTRYLGKLVYGVPSRNAMEIGRVALGACRRRPQSRSSIPCAFHGDDRQPLKVHGQPRAGSHLLCQPLSTFQRM